MNKIIPIRSADRSCGECTLCCEGWLIAEVHGHELGHGKKCHYLGEKACTIYEDRPVDPCQLFKCEWLVNHDIPEWMKPNLSKVILVSRHDDDCDYLEAFEAGQKMDSSILQWLLLWVVNKKLKNLKYQVNRGWYYLSNTNVGFTAGKLEERK